MKFKIFYWNIVANIKWLRFTLQRRGYSQKQQCYLTTLCVKNLVFVTVLVYKIFFVCVFEALSLRCQSAFISSSPKASIHELQSRRSTIDHVMFIVQTEAVWNVLFLVMRSFRKHSPISVRSYYNAHIHDNYMRGAFPE